MTTPAAAVIEEAARFYEDLGSQLARLGRTEVVLAEDVRVGDEIVTEHGGRIVVRITWTKRYCDVRIRAYSTSDPVRGVSMTYDLPATDAVTVRTPRPAPRWVDTDDDPNTLACHPSPPPLHGPLNKEDVG